VTERSSLSARKPLTDASLNEYDEHGVQTRFAISPFGASETRAERIARWEAAGSLDPDCPGCREFYEHPRLDPFAPHHRPGRMCESGKRPHCTCPLCWG
jgi:hypothetical protein